MHDDIPEAFRQPVPEISSVRTNTWVWVGSGVGLVAVALGGWLILGVINPTPPQSAADKPELLPTATPATEESPDNILGHLVYEEAPLDQLAPVSSDGRLRLRQSAAKAYQRMTAAARAAGVNLQLLSAFRTKEEQNYLFFKVKEQRAQATTQRAGVSAPPGHSEHHTGYAIDVGDSTQPKTQLTQSFEQTAAFKWLDANAARFSFELSFPKGNAQGVNYEPWHWRYVGDQDSLKTFYSARKLKVTKEAE